MINGAIAGRPADMRITMHLCRGNFRSSWIARGGYEPVAEVLFNTIGGDGYFMEYDTERAGGFEPLRLVPKTRRCSWAWSRPRPASWNRKTRSTGASTTTLAVISISTNSALARSAVSRAPKKATS